MSRYSLRVAALAGGVGGARLAYGLANSLLPGSLDVIVNIGDDFEHLGLIICPDLDTVCYTLAGLDNPSTGWGLVGETWNALEGLAALGGPAWFRIGDRDLGTHLERTRRMRNGNSLSQVTRHFCSVWGIGITVLPASDDSIPTWVYTDEGEMPFQEYFVKHQCRPAVKGFRFEACDQARPAPGVLEALQQADLIVICPSNPWVSIDPILAIPGIRPLVASRPALAVSPIIGGQAVKGPAAKMYTELGIEPSAASVAGHYAGLLNGFVFDEVDKHQADIIGRSGVQLYTTDTLMRDRVERNRLAGEVLEFGELLMG